MFGGGYFYLKNDKPKFNEPNNLDGWINLCNEDLNFFEELEATNELEKQNSKRQKILESIINKFYWTKGLSKFSICFEK